FFAFARDRPAARHVRFAARFMQLRVQQPFPRAHAGGLLLGQLLVLAHFAREARAPRALFFGEGTENTAAAKAAAHAETDEAEQKYARQGDVDDLHRAPPAASAEVEQHQ